MSFTEAMAIVNNGGYAWRVSWSGKYLLNHSGAIYVNDHGTIGPYNATTEEQAATNWDGGDKPPHL